MLRRLTTAPRHRRPAVALAAAGALLLLVAPGADAANRTRCDGTHGTELAHSKIVKVYKVKTGSSYRFYGCAKPRGPVYPLTRSFKGTQVKLVAAKAAYVAFTRTLQEEETVSVVDARTGRQQHGLYPPSQIEFDADPLTPQIGVVRLNDLGEVAISYIGLGAGNSTDSTTYIYAQDASHDEQLFDSGPSRQIPPKSLKLNGEDVSWTHGGVTRTAKVGSFSFSVVSGGGAGSGDVTTTPDHGIACHLGSLSSTSGTCVGSFAPNDFVTVVATGAADSTVTISGGCSAVHAPQAGQTTSVASCSVRLNRAQQVKVTFS